MEGFLNLCKPPGMTSHDIVAWVRRSFNLRKVGHTGTLDPGAAGVLVICLNKATKLASYIQNGDKGYRAEMKLGFETTTFDAFGETTGQSDVPRLTKDHIERVLSEVVGDLKQVPPMTSAIKVGGQKLYKLARKNIKVQVPARDVTIYRCTLVSWDPSHSKIIFDVTCSKGTYIRSLCVDIAKRLGTIGHMTFLLRTNVGSFPLATSQTLDECLAKPVILPMITALHTWDKVFCCSVTINDIVHGRQFEYEGIDKEIAAAVNEDNELVALVKKVDNNLWQPFKVFFGG